MGKSLVIVESPAKAKTINKYLGSDYVVEASFGHIKKGPKKRNWCRAQEQNIRAQPSSLHRDKEKLVAQLKKLAAKADAVFPGTRS